MSAHRWALAVVLPLTDREAGQLENADMLERIEAVRGLLAPADALPKVTAIRGPICADCRVSRADFLAMEAKSKPWPCPGRRPDALGGPLYDPATARRAENRQQRRSQHRKATKAAEGRAERQAIDAKVRTAVIAARSAREEAKA